MLSRVYYLNLFGSTYLVDDKLEIRYTFDVSISSASRRQSKYIRVSLLLDAKLAERWGYKIWSRNPKRDYELLEHTLVNLTYREIERRIVMGIITAQFECRLTLENSPLTFPRFAKELTYLTFDEYKIEIPIRSNV